MPSSKPKRRRARWLAGALVLALLLGLTATGYRMKNSTTFQVAGELVSRVDTDEKVVALTFDDGPTPADADAVLGALAGRGVRATFYVNGRPLTEAPDVGKRIVEAGHELGNHTWSHRRMVLVTPGIVADEVEPTDEAIRRMGYEGEITFRPPYGDKLLTLPLYLARHDRTTVTWDISPERWDAEQAADEIIDGTLSGVQPGSIILLHPWNGRTAVQQAIGPIVDHLTAQGYRFVTVSELLAMR